MLFLLNLVAQLCRTVFHPVDCRPPGSSVHGVSQARILEWVAMPSSRRFSQPRESNPGLPHCWWILYHLSHQGSPATTGVGSLSLLQGNFPTQESNWGLLHCRRILYHMSCQVSLIVSFYSLFFNFLFCSVLFLCSVSGYFCVFCVWLFFIDIMCEKMWRHILRFCLIVSSSRQGFFHSSHQNWFRDEFHTYKICLFLGHSYS